MSDSVLITGANGFIGSHVTRLLETLGHKTIPLDVLPRSADLSLPGIKTSCMLDVTDCGGNCPAAGSKAQWR